MPFFSPDFFTDFFDIGTPPVPEGGGIGRAVSKQMIDDDDDILLAWFMLMRQ